MTIITDTKVYKNRKNGKEVIVLLGGNNSKKVLLEEVKSGKVYDRGTKFFLENFIEA